MSMNFVKHNWKWAVTLTILDVALLIICQAARAGEPIGISYEDATRGIAQHFKKIKTPKNLISAFTSDNTALYNIRGDLDHITSISYTMFWQSAPKKRKLNIRNLGYMTQLMKNVDSSWDCIGWITKSIKSLPKSKREYAVIGNTRYVMKLGHLGMVTLDILHR